MKTHLLDSTPCGISQVKDVATVKRAVFYVGLCHRRTRWSAQTAEVAQAVKINMGAVKLKLDLCRLR